MFSWNGFVLLNSISPRSGFCSPAIVLIKVDLPEPFGPIRQVKLPFSKVRLMFCKTDLPSLFCRDGNPAERSETVNSALSFCRPTLQLIVKRKEFYEVFLLVKIDGIDFKESLDVFFLICHSLKHLLFFRDFMKV